MSFEQKFNKDDRFNLKKKLFTRYTSARRAMQT